MSSENKNKYRFLRNFNLIVGLAIPIICFFITLSYISVDFDIVDFFAGITTFFAVIGLYGWLLYFALTSKMMQTTGWLILTILLILSCPVVVGFTTFMLRWSYFGILFPIALTLGLSSPFIALITGIQGTVAAAKQGRKVLAWITLFTALAPFLFVGLNIILAQYGIWIIRFM